MKISKGFLNKCQAEISNGEVENVLKELLGTIEETGYKNEILMLNNRWKNFSRDNLAGILTNEDQRLQNAKFSNDLLILIEALDHEMTDGKAIPNLFQPNNNRKKIRNLFLYTYLPMILTGVGIWGLSYFAYYEKPISINCDPPFYMDGEWKTFSNYEDEIKEIGYVKIKQDSCSHNFSFKGDFNHADPKNEEVTFYSKIGGFFNDNDIYFVYANSRNEEGVCHGIIPIGGLEKDTFHITCSDLEGKNLDTFGTKTNLIFTRIKRE